MIRLMENTTGRLRLIKRADGYEREVAAGRDFWDVMADRYGLTLEVVAGSLDGIPREGPLIVIANHPFGILDGLMMGVGFTAVLVLLGGMRELLPSCHQRTYGHRLSPCLPSSRQPPLRRCTHQSAPARVGTR